MTQKQSTMFNRIFISEDDGTASPEAELVVKPVETEPDASGDDC